MAVNNYTPEELTIWVTIVSTAVGAFVLSFRAIKDWAQDRWTRTHDVASVDVEKARVLVSEKEAETHELTAIFDGFTAALAAATARAVAAEDAVKEMRVQMRESETTANIRHEAMERRIDGVVEINSEMMTHIKVLEGMVPYPPGPPTRPTNWRVN